jgi:SAM-dependent methyltransferase
VQTPDEIRNWYRTFTPARSQRDNWYGSVAQAYDRVRPKYSQAFLDRAIEVAAIPSAGQILEVGCGPGTATISLAQQGFSVIALEPNLEAATLARQNLAGHPNVTIINTNFEDWEPENHKVDAIVAATSWHWVAPEHKHQKAASLLNPHGSLILLWNTAMQPPPAIFESLADILAQYLPTMSHYKQERAQIDEIRIFANAAIESGLFTDLREEYQLNEVDYAIDDYLLLLTTYSPCIALSELGRQELLIQLRVILKQKCGDWLPLSYLSIFHVFAKSA